MQLCVFGVYILLAYVFVYASKQMFTDFSVFVLGM